MVKIHSFYSHLGNNKESKKKQQPFLLIQILYNHIPGLLSQSNVPVHCAL